MKPSSKLLPGEIIRCRYRVWIHRGAPDVEKVKQAYRACERAQPMRRERK